MGKLSSRKRSNTKKVDRLSGLSDHLLCHILSFLPTKFAMATSVLSRRWEYVWPGIPALNFTEDFKSIADEQQYQSLEHFLNRVLLHNRELCLERLDFDIHPLMREEDLKEWFMVLSRRSIKEVNLFYDQHRDLSITDLLDGTCGEHLVKLNIEGGTEDMMIFPIDSMLRFERLEIINLAQIEITDGGEPISSLVRGSPCLRELVLFQCSGFAIDFRCLTIKILKLLQCDFTTIKIGVPNLEYFELFIDDDEHSQRCLEVFVLVDDMPRLSKAKVYNCSIRADTWEYILYRLQHVIKLNISLSCFIDEQDVALVTRDFKLPYFKRLKYLEISCCEEHGLLQTRIFLSHMPNCVSLIIHMKWQCSCADLLKLWPTKNSSSLGLHVEYIEIYGIGRTRLAIVELLRYVLACFKGLKEVKLHLSNEIHSGWKNIMPKTIMNLPRPTDCKITICDLLS